MSAVANHAYASIWCEDFSEAAMPGRFENFLATVPFSATRPGFTNLVIRALEATESPVLESDLRAFPLDAAGLVELVADHLHADSAYETTAHWDLWVYDVPTSRWLEQPQPLEIFCYGGDYDDGAWQETGHLEVDAGFEHLFTGHAGLLGFHSQPAAAPQHPIEAEFLAAMARPENQCVYQAKTQENIRRLFAWMQHVEKALPVERYQLWSEGEDNFEARMEEILAAR